MERPYRLKDLGEDFNINFDGDDCETDEKGDINVVVHPETDQVIGFTILISGRVASESADIKIFGDFKFNLEGVMIDSRDQSFGYHE